MSTPIPTAGQWIRTDHHCWWPGTTPEPTAEHPATLHNEPIQVMHVETQGGVTGDWRIEARRCDGTMLTLVVDDAGNELLHPWDAAETGYEIVPAPEAVAS